MMEKLMRYHIVEDRTRNCVMIVDVLTGTVQYPSCWQDIAAYYHYLLDRNRLDEAQNLLAEAMSGAKPMTRMVYDASHVAIPALDATAAHALPG
jgi:hypothetical protein